MEQCGNTHSAVVFCLKNDSLLPQLVLQGHSRTKYNKTLIRKSLSLINQGHWLRLHGGALI